MTLLKDSEMMSSANGELQDKIARRCARQSKALAACVLVHHDDSCKNCDPAGPGKCDPLLVKLETCQGRLAAPAASAAFERCNRSIMSQGVFEGRRDCASERQALTEALALSGAV